MILLPAAAAGLLLWLWRKKKISRPKCLLMLALTALSALVLISEKNDGGREEITGIARADREAALEVETSDGEIHEVVIRIPAEELTPEQAQTLLREKAAELPEIILGKNPSADHIEWDLELPVTFADSAITAAWSTSDPEILDWSGHIGPEVDAAGEKVVLCGVLFLDEEMFEMRQELLVFPSREEKALAERLQAAGNALDDGHGGIYQLPVKLDGEKLVWFREREKKGTVLAVFVLLAVILLALAGKEEEKKKKKRRETELAGSYPAFLSRISLLYEAGLSTRRVFERLARDHQRSLQETGRSSAAYEEAARASYEMASGVDTETVFMNYGKRCGLPAYRGLALLLARTQKKGTALLLPLLEKEVQEACEARRRRARAEGEKAAVRLLLPMVMMLAVVLAVLMVPAVMSF